MDSSIVCLIFSVLAYLCGSIPFGKLIAQFYHKVDIQKTGSGNIGFANVLRNLGWKAAVPVLFGDVSKGLVPVLVAKSYLSGYQLMLVAGCAIVGHVFPVWLRFKGGKGIATGLGVVLALNPLLGIVGLGIYLLGFALFRQSAPSSMLATWCVVGLSFIVLRDYSWFLLLMAILATWTHRDNIKQLSKALATHG